MQHLYEVTLIDVTRSHMPKVAGPMLMPSLPHEGLIIGDDGNHWRVRAVYLEGPKDGNLLATKVAVGVETAKGALW
jgi:hypothetical protein